MSLQHEVLTNMKLGCIYRVRDIPVNASSEGVRRVLRQLSRGGWWKSYAGTGMQEKGFTCPDNKNLILGE